MSFPSQRGEVLSGTFLFASQISSRVPSAQRDLFMNGGVVIHGGSRASVNGRLVVVTAFDHFDESSLRLVIIGIASVRVITGRISLFWMPIIPSFVAASVEIVNIRPSGLT